MQNQMQNPEGMLNGIIYKAINDIPVQIEQNLREELPEITLITSAAPKYTEVSLSLIKYLVNNRKFAGIYVTVNRPYESMKQMLEKTVDLRYLVFIDGSSSSAPTSVDKDKKDLYRAWQEVRVSRIQKSKPEQTKECLYLANIKNLTDFIMAIDQAIGALQALQNPVGVKKFLVLDSPSTLLIYNDAGSVSKFLHYIAMRLRESKVKGIFLVLERESDKNFIDQLCLFSDNVLNIK
ncbi:MAG: hypothetical protein OIN66_03060 [Candidatus Methanoperedens sp.]|nr:hypothetical protein [Candidatus Methanoperedens sp.]